MKNTCLVNLEKNLTKILPFKRLKLKNDTKLMGFVVRFLFYEKTFSSSICPCAHSSIGYHCRFYCLRSVSLWFCYRLAYCSVDVDVLHPVCASRSWKDYGWGVAAYGDQTILVHRTIFLGNSRFYQCCDIGIC